VIGRNADHFEQEMLRHRESPDQEALSIYLRETFAPAIRPYKLPRCAEEAIVGMVESALRRYKPNRGERAAWRIALRVLFQAIQAEEAAAGRRQRRLRQRTLWLRQPPGFSLDPPKR